MDITQLSSLDPDAAARIIARVGDSIFLISNKAKTSVLQNPGLGQPWSTKNRSVAVRMAKQVGNGAFVCTLREAFDAQLKLFKN